VGTSIITNFCKALPKDEEIEKYKVKEWPTLPPSHSLQEVIKEISTKKSHSVYNHIYKFLKDNPERASAELNALLSYEKIRGKVPKKIYLLITDTGTGILCGTLLQDYLRENNYEVMPPKVMKGFGIDHTLFDTALASLMHEILSIASVEATYKSKIILNATGGFKPETCFAVIAALLSQKIDVIYYIHESFRTLVFLPTPPLELPPPLKQKLLKLDNYPKSTINLISISDEEVTRLTEKKLIRDDGKGNIVMEEWVKPLIQEKS
ncbi:MAG: putative CRISPR-associated protein, partial [Thermoplasmata archaeon]